MGHILANVGNHGVRIGRIAGIRITLDWTWFFIATLAVGSITSAFAAAGTGFLLALLGGLLVAGGFFGSILAHELGHALTARRFGIRTESIALHVFGGVARLMGEPRTPRQELLISAAGPAVSLALAGGFWLLALALPAGLTIGLNVVVATFSNLAYANLVLGLFNLLPGFPLDGGRILRAWLWSRKRSYSEGTRIAAKVGEGVGLGLMCLAAGLLFMTGAFGSSLMLGAIGFVVRQAARAEGLRVGSRVYARPSGHEPGGGGESRGGTARVVRLPDGRIVIVHDI